MDEEQIRQITRDIITKEGPSNKITLIKLLREQTGLLLKEAKDIVEEELESKTYLYPNGVTTILTIMPPSANPIEYIFNVGLSGNCEDEGTILRDSSRDISIFIPKTYAFYLKIERPGDLKTTDMFVK